MTHLQPTADPEPHITPSTAPPPRATRVRLWIAGCAILIAAILLVWQFPFLDHSQELVDLWKISEQGVTGFVVFLVALTLMTGAWLWVIWDVRGHSFRDCWLPVTAFTALIYVAFLLVYPATAIDVYIYAARSHLFSDYGMNPSTAIPRTYWEVDPYVQYASWEWSDRPSPYGPLWNVIAAPVTALDRESIETAVLLFKALMVGSTVAVGALIYSIGKVIQPRYALPAALAWLWSPVVLWEGIANSHNDAMFVLPVVAALWCWYRRHDGWILPLLGAAALLKVVALILIPVALVAIVSRNGANRRLLTIGLQTAALSIAVLWVAFIPYFDITGTIDAVQSQRAVWVTSPVLLLEAMNNEWAWGLDLRGTYERFSTAVIVLVTTIGAVLAWRRPEWFPRIAYEQLFWFLLLATSNLRPWYAIWLVALAVAIPLGMPLIRAAAWSIGMLFSYGYSGWVQNWSNPEWLERNAINLGIMLVPILLVMLWSATRMARPGGRGRAEASAAMSRSPIS